jgi:hypothetical protein
VVYEELHKTGCIFANAVHAFARSSCFLSKSRLNPVLELIFMDWRRKTSFVTHAFSRPIKFYISLFVSVFVLVGIGAAMIWSTDGGRPFRQIALSLKTADGRGVKCFVVLPKPTGKHPVVIYLQDAGQSLLGSEVDLRQFGELGLAAVCLEYGQTNQSVFDEQLIALRQYLQQQSWAQSNVTAWVGFGLEAQKALTLAIRHPELQPQLLVGLNSGWGEELNEKFEVNNPQTKNASSNEGGMMTFPAPSKQFAAADKSLSAIRIHCPVLLVHGERDEVLPMANVQRLAEWLRSQGAVVETQVLPKLSHDFGEDHGVVIRAVAEYCAANLALPDYTDHLVGCQLNGIDRERFNRAMQRAGKRQCELWHAVIAAREPERDTMMNVIGGLEDYDLAHISMAQLEGCVDSAWRARRKYPWCRDTPMEIFDRFVATPRIYEEPLDDWSDPYGPTLIRVVKYCHTTAEASDALWGWMRLRALKKTTSEMERREEILSLIRGGCYGFSIAFTGLGRTVGLPVRPAWTLWPTLGNDHYWNEIWSVEENQWHAFDASALNRSYNADWLNQVDKSVIQVPTGERGAWNAVADQRWESLTNSVGLFYPSGQVLVRVLNNGQPVPNRRVGIQIWLGNGMGGRVKFWQPEVFTIAEAITDQKGEARLVLGKSAEQPYRIFLNTSKDSDWQWLAVQANHTYTITLETGKQKMFDINTIPPPLGKLEDEPR